MKKVNENKGFTLAELLIVVAIIGVLVAVSIPVFNNELEKSREAADLGNLRTAYAVGSTYLLAHPENTADKLYFNPSAPESISLISTDDGAKVGRKASVSGQQSGDAKINFDTDYTFGPTSDTGAGMNLANSNAVIEITVTSDNTIALVSFSDDKAPLSVVWKSGKPDKISTKVGTKTADFTVYDLPAQLDIMSYGEDASDDVTYEEADATPGNKTSLAYYQLELDSDNKIAVDTEIENATDGGATTYIPIKVSATVDTVDYSKVIYVPVKIAP